MKQPTVRALLALIFFGFPGFIQSAEGQSVANVTPGEVQMRSYLLAEADERIPYALYVPTSYRPSQPSALIVALHGLGSNSAQIMRYQGLTDLAEKRGYIVVAPMGYNERGWYGSRGTGKGSSRIDRAEDPDNLGELSELDVLNVLELVQAEYSVDPDRIYLMGHSMGGGGSWHLGIKYAGIWDALGPVAPAIYTTPDALAAITTTPVIVVMGDADELVDVEVTRRWVAKMAELGMDYEYVEIPGGDHTGIIARDPRNMERIFDFFDRAQTN